MATTHVKTIFSYEEISLTGPRYICIRNGYVLFGLELTDFFVKRGLPVLRFYCDAINKTLKIVPEFRRDIYLGIAAIHDQRTKLMYTKSHKYVEQCIRPGIYLCKPYKEDGKTVGIIAYDVDFNLEADFHFHEVTLNIKNQTLMLSKNIMPYMARSATVALRKDLPKSKQPLVPDLPDLEDETKIQKEFKSNRPQQPKQGAGDDESDESAEGESDESNDDVQED